MNLEAKYTLKTSLSRRSLIVAVQSVELRNYETVKIDR